MAMKSRTFLIVLAALMGVVAVGTRTGVIPSVKRILGRADGQETGILAGPMVAKSAGLTADELNNIDVYKLARNATVHITSTTYQRGFFYELIPGKETGTGFIIRDDGLILTNYHVISGDQQPEVTMPNSQKRYAARILARDRRNDLALIKIDAPAKLAALKMGDSDPLQVGQKVLAIGNPFEFDFTLTTGIVSSVGRSIRTQGGVLEGMIQTDAAINPGNSGGPLLDSQGSVVGINTAIYGNEGSIGIGFAMPINRAKILIEDYAAGRKTGPVWLGVETMPIAGELAEALELPSEGGLLVQGIYRGSPAAKAGIRPPQRELQIGRYVILVGGDLITAVEGQKAAARDAIIKVLARKRPGDSMALEVFRDGRRQTLRVQLEEAPDNYQTEQ
jgi:putative serine protease PepD